MRKRFAVRGDRAALWSLALAMMVLLGGCTGLSRGDDDMPPLATAATAAASFHAQGRFSARYEEEAFSARFDWQHAPSTDVIEFTSPLGATVARLTRAGEAITVQQGSDPQRSQQMKNWEALTTQVFGFPLPVENLVYWAQGVPLPEVAAAVRRDAAGRLDNLRQQGWEVQYSYATAAAMQPERLDIRYGETIGLRLKIDRLQPLAESPP